MKKKILATSLIASLFLTNFASAETIQYQGQTKNAYYNETASWIGGVVPTITDDVIIDPANLVDQSRTYDLNLSDNAAAASITIIDRPINQISSVNGSKTLTIAGDLTKIEKNATETSIGINSGGYWHGATEPVGDAPLDVIIGGKIIIGEAADPLVAGAFPKSGGKLTFGGVGSPDSTTSWGRATNSVTIGGDVELYGSSGLLFNAFRRDGSSSIDNPDVKIHGVVRFSGIGDTGNPDTSYQYPLFSLAEGLDSSNISSSATTYVAVGGMDGNSTLSSNVYEADAPTAILSVLILENAAGTVYNHTGWTWDNKSARSDKNKLKFVMNGEGTQKFTGGRLGFSGGVEARKGMIAFRAVSTADNYASSNHGDLSMLGGKLALEDAKGNGVFGFNNLILSNGTIALTVGATSVDYIKLYGTIVAGDQLGTLLFEFTNGSIDFLTEDYRKIVEWTTKTTLTEESFVGKQYGDLGADFEIRDDGLYVKYINVPEPAAVAFILGGIALAMAIARRRK